MKTEVDTLEFHTLIFKTSSWQTLDQKMSVFVGIFLLSEVLMLFMVIIAFYFIAGG